MLGLGLSLWSGKHTGGGSAAEYQAEAVHFDGDDDLTIESLTASDGGTVGVSFWLRFAESQADEVIYVSDENTFTNFCWLPLDRSEFWFSNAAGSRTLDFQPPSGLSVDTWYHVLCAVKTDLAAGNKIAALYINDDLVMVAANDASDAFNVEVNGLPFKFGGGPVIDVADFWYAPGQNLLSGSEIPEATRRKFISAGGKPVSLGSDGSTPTGDAPAIFFSGDANAFPTNRGTGGSFTLGGSLTNASTSPSD